MEAIEAIVHDLKIPEKKQALDERRELMSYIKFGMSELAFSDITEVETKEKIDILSTDVIDQIDLSHTNKLMIVAHPDDESLFGGAHLSEGGYLVLCLTNGKKEVRKNDFFDVLEISGNKGIILDYPDTSDGKRDDWLNYYDSISEDIKTVLNYKEWDIIVTHNKNGEYGHIQHKMTNAMVTESYESLGVKGKLYYFGRYYRTLELEEIEDELPRMSEEAISVKYEMLDCYQSEKATVDLIIHMAPYEEWIEYGE